MYKDQISAWAEAHRAELVEDIKRLVRIRSDREDPLPGKPYGEGPAAVLKDALELAGSYGFYTNNVENYVGTVDLMPENDHQLDVLSHLDVVPVADDWSVTAPFDPIEKDGKLYGRGTADDKGPSVAALYALRCVKELDLPVKHNVRLIWGCDEECGSSDIAYYYQKESEAKYTFSPDADYPVINIEKGGFGGSIQGKFAESTALPRVREITAGLKINVVPDTCHMVLEGMRKTVAEIYCAAAFDKTGVRFTVTDLGDKVIAIDAKGAGAHAAHPQDGNNAITASLSLLSTMHLAPCAQFDAICALTELLPHGDYLGAGLGVKMEDEASGELTLSADIIRVTTTEMEVKFDSRTPLCATEENTLLAARKVCEAKGLSLAADRLRPPHHVPADSLFIRTLLGAYEKYTGVKDAKPIAIGGGTYCHEIENGVAFGCTMPGTDNRMHGNNEFAVVDELVASVKIFAEAMLQLCGE